MFWVKWAVKLLEFALRQAGPALKAARAEDDVALCVKVLRRAIRQASKPVNAVGQADNVDMALAGLRSALEDQPASW